jgi:hypothetical protein
MQDSTYLEELDGEGMQNPTDTETIRNVFMCEGNSELFTNYSMREKKSRFNPIIQGLRFGLRVVVVVNFTQQSM